MSERSEHGKRRAGHDRPRECPVFAERFLKDWGLLGAKARAGVGSEPVVPTVTLSIGRMATQCNVSDLVAAVRRRGVDLGWILFDAFCEVYHEAGDEVSPSLRALLRAAEVHAESTRNLPAEEPTPDEDMDVLTGMLVEAGFVDERVVGSVDTAYNSGRGHAWGRGCSDLGS